MKRSVKRVFSWLLVGLELLTLAACAPQSEGPGVPDDTQPPAAVPDFFGPASGYVIVRSDKAGASELDAFLRFKRSVQQKNGSIVPATDWLAPGAEPAAEEILFGNTNRPETAEALALVDGAGYVICVLNRKLVIAATSDKALGNAVTYFTENYLEGDMQISGEYAVIGAETVRIPDVTVNGTALKEFTLTAESLAAWDLPVYTLSAFFTKYCGITLKTAASAAAGEGHKIVLGGRKADGSPYARFETELYFKDGDLHLGCANPTMAQKIIYTLIDQYLDRDGTAELVLPEGESLFRSETGDDWDSADPKEFLSIQDRICRGCYKLQAILEWDTSLGKHYTYENQGYKTDFAVARREGVLCTNCVILGNWVMRDAGFYTNGIYNHKYDGSFGYAFDGASKSFFTTYCDIIDVRDENVSIRQMIAANRVWPGDIIGYKDHNQTVLPHGNAFDGGKGNCVEHKVGAEFARWVGATPYPNMQVGFIFRAKDAEWIP